MCFTFSAHRYRFYYCATLGHLAVDSLSFLYRFELFAIFCIFFLVGLFSILCIGDRDYEIDDIMRANLERLNELKPFKCNLHR